MLLSIYFIPFLSRPDIGSPFHASYAVPCRPGLSRQNQIGPFPTSHAALYLTMTFPNCPRLPHPATSSFVKPRRDTPFQSLPADPNPTWTLRALPPEPCPSKPKLSPPFLTCLSDLCQSMSFHPLPTCPGLASPLLPCHAESVPAECCPVAPDLQRPAAPYPPSHYFPSQP